MVFSHLQATTLGWLFFAYYGCFAPVLEVAISIQADPRGRPGSQGVENTEASQAGSADALSASSGGEKPSSENHQGAIAAEIKHIESMHRAILANQSIEQWRFDTVRSRYLALLKRAGADRDVEEAIRVRLALVTRHEQAAEAARTMQTILAESHRRDREVAKVKRGIAAAGRSRARAYSAVGFMQPSAQRIDGRKLYILIANNGSTVAYLDMPAGLDTGPLVSQRVGVRGVPHFNEDLGTRLITVQDIDAIDARR